MQELAIEMESQLESYANANMFDGSADAGSEVLGLKCKALILEIIHAIDVVGHLIKNDIKSTNEWMWQKQLRFYLQKGTVIVF